MGKLRFAHIDVLKGVGIVLMVLGHMHFDDEIFGKFVYAFHMPLFFLISGYLYQKPIDCKHYIVKKMYTLLVPYFSFGIIYTLISV